MVTNQAELQPDRMAELLTAIRQGLESLTVTGLSGTGRRSGPLPASGGACGRVCIRGLNLSHLVVLAHDQNQAMADRQTQGRLVRAGASPLCEDQSRRRARPSRHHPARRYIDGGHRQGIPRSPRGRIPVKGRPRAPTPRPHGLVNHKPSTGGNTRPRDANDHGPRLNCMCARVRLPSTVATPPTGERAKPPIGAI